MPLADEQLIIEPSYPYAQLAEIGAPKVDEDAGWRLVNEWYSQRHGAIIILMRDPEGRLQWGKRPAVHSLRQQLRTLGCSDAWGIEQEGAALQLLGQMLRHRAFKQYLLTGAFLERSERSGITYMFRKLRPTVAISTRGDDSRIIAALCMHPIAYYAGSWAGAMCPTDDVIAHLALMRGDEHMFWKRCNQHPAWRPEAGL